MQINNIQNGQNNAVYGVRSAAEVSEKEQEKVRETGEELHNRDEYIPSEKDEPIGIYAVSPDDEGNPKIDYNSPEKADKEPEDMPEKSESCTTNTDNVDREIKQLKEQAQQISQRINSAEGKEREHLEKQLKSVQSELSQKDNDNYRRQHAVIS